MNIEHYDFGQTMLYCFSPLLSFESDLSLFTILLKVIFSRTGNKFYLHNYMDCHDLLFSWILFKYSAFEICFPLASVTLTLCIPVPLVFLFACFAFSIDEDSVLRFSISCFASCPIPTVHSKCTHHQLQGIHNFKTTCSIGSTSYRIHQCTVRHHSTSSSFSSLLFNCQVNWFFLLFLFFLACLRYTLIDEFLSPQIFACAVFMMS